jgi:radical SAM protein with 4Fe4S-binding SPASM domain
MYIEKNKVAKRKMQECIEYDKEYLRSYCETHNKFPLFSQVLIETRTDCNKRCAFCPQSFYKRSLEVMPWHVYVKIIDSLADIGFSGRIALFVSNEPLLETRLEEMIRYAKQKSPRFFLDITTNGLLLNIEKVDSLFSVGLDNININDYRNDRTDFIDKVSEHLIPIVCTYRYNPKISYNARATMEMLPNYAGVIPQDFYSDDLGFCNFPFRKLVFDVNGNVLLCCNDFKHTTSFGNIQNKSILEMWYSPQMNEIRQNLLRDRRVALCANCNDYQDYSIYKNE